MPKINTPNKGDSQTIELSKKNKIPPKKRATQTLTTSAVSIENLAISFMFEIITVINLYKTNIF